MPRKTKLGLRKVEISNLMSHPAASKAWKVASIQRRCTSMGLGRSLLEWISMSSTNAVRNSWKWRKGNCDGVSPFSLKKACRASSRNVQQTARWAICNEADQPWASLAWRQTAFSTKKLKKFLDLSSISMDGLQLERSMVVTWALKKLTSILWILGNGAVFSLSVTKLSNLKSKVMQ